MSVTVVVRRQAAAGAETPLFAGPRGLAFELPPPHGCSAVRIFRGYLDPTVLLWVADWESRALYDAILLGPTFNAEHTASITECLQRSYFHLGRTYGVMGRTPASAICGLIRAPRGAGEATRALWSDGAGALRAVPGFAHWYAYSDEDDPDHFMTISEWESPAAAHAYLDGPARDMLPRLGQAGATFEPFVEIRRETS